jgi:hypothetical protein
VAVAVVASVAVVVGCLFVVSVTSHLQTVLDNYSFHRAPLANQFFLSPLFIALVCSLVCSYFLSCVV